MTPAWSLRTGGLFKKVVIKTLLTIVENLLQCHSIEKLSHFRALANKSRCRKNRSKYQTDHKTSELHHIKTLKYHSC